LTKPAILNPPLTEATGVTPGDRKDVVAQIVPRGPTGRDRMRNADEIANSGLSRIPFHQRIQLFLGGGTAQI